MDLAFDFIPGRIRFLCIVAQKPVENAAFAGLKVLSGDFVEGLFVFVYSAPEKRLDNRSKAELFSSRSIFVSFRIQQRSINDILDGIPEVGDFVFHDVPKGRVCRLCSLDRLRNEGNDGSQDAGKEIAAHDPGANAGADRIHDVLGAFRVERFGDVVCDSLVARSENALDDGLDDRVQDVSGHIGGNVDSADEHFQNASNEGVKGLLDAASEHLSEPGVFPVHAFELCVGRDSIFSPDNLAPIDCSARVILLVKVLDRLFALGLVPAHDAGQDGFPPVAADQCGLDSRHQAIGKAVIAFKCLLDVGVFPDILRAEDVRDHSGHRSEDLRSELSASFAQGSCCSEKLGENACNRRLAFRTTERVLDAAENVSDRSGQAFQPFCEALTVVQGVCEAGERILDAFQDRQGDRLRFFAKGSGVVFQEIPQVLVHERDLVGSKLGRFVGISAFAIVPKLRILPVFLVPLRVFEVVDQVPGCRDQCEDLADWSGLDQRKNSRKGAGNGFDSLRHLAEPVEDLSDALYNANNALGKGGQVAGDLGANAGQVVLDPVGAFIELVRDPLDRLFQVDKQLRADGLDQVGDGRFQLPEGALQLTDLADRVSRIGHLHFLIEFDQVVIDGFERLVFLDVVQGHAHLLEGFLFGTGLLDRLMLFLGELLQRNFFLGSRFNPLVNGGRCGRQCSRQAQRLHFVRIQQRE